MSPDSKHDFAPSAASWWRELGTRGSEIWLLPTSKDYDWIQDGSDAHDVAELGNWSVLPLLATIFQGVQVDTDHWQHFYWMPGMMWGLFAASVAFQ